MQLCCTSSSTNTARSCADAVNSLPSIPNASKTSTKSCSRPPRIPTPTTSTSTRTMKSKLKSATKSRSTLSGFFLGFGGDAILWKNFGIGGEVSVQPAKSQFITSAYGPLDYRQTFYDFNGIYEPVHSKRVALEWQAGVGGAKSGFSITSSNCVGSACVSQSQPVVNSNHFQVHAGVGVSLFVTEHIFIRPQFDIHYVPNLNTQPGFGSNLVTAGMVWVGYNFGSR